VKTFFGERKKYEVEVAISDKIEALKTKVHNEIAKLSKEQKPEDFESYHCIRFVYPMVREVVSNAEGMD
jgi:preprotein translocase subunit SecB